MFSRRSFIAGVSSVPIAYTLQRVGVASSGTPLTKNFAAETVNLVATKAAERMLLAGGNAIDGAVAAALTLGVVDGHNSGLGGGCLGLVRLADSTIHAVDGREKAPAAATRDMYLRNGKAVGQLSQTGALAIAVPSQAAALAQMHQKWGKLPWAKLFEPAIEAAQDGFIVNRSTAKTIADQASNLAQFEASKVVLLSKEGKPPKQGDRLIQMDLANTLRKLAEQGVDWFYRGEFAAQCVEYLSSIGGILSLRDFKDYNVVERMPLETRYRGYSVIGFPPPSSGGMHIAQMLNMLNYYSLSDIYLNSRVDYYHLVAECMRRAFADRAYWLGDSDFIDVPKGLLDPQYALARMKSFEFGKAGNEVSHGLPPGANEGQANSDLPFSPGVSDDQAKHTTHLTVADTDGNWVALTNTVNTSWGSKVMVPRTGIMLNNQMDDFSIAPGTPNAFGLVGSKANAIAPGKRPLSSMSPTIVLDKDRLPVLTCGAAGGPRIINATLQIILRTLDLNETIEQAIARPRIHHQWQPNTLYYESDAFHNSQPNNSQPSSILVELRSRGHELKEAAALAVAQGIQRVGDTLLSAHDPRI